jgi:outer membrane lipoprotein LolB
MGSALFATILIAACAQFSSVGAQNDAQTEQWSGRIGLQTLSTPPQSFFAAFALQGNAKQGDLTLTSPLGTTLAYLSWTPGNATLSSSGQVRAFPSLSQALLQATGSELPVAALFDWLANVNTAAPSAGGWTVDLTGYAAGRINAVRNAPEPRAELRIVLDK